MIRFTSPEWLILLPLVVAAGWYWRALELTRPLRAILVALLLFLLCGPQVRRQNAGLDVWVLTDRSASCAELVEPRVPEMQALLDRSKKREDRLHWVDFADLVQPREGKDLAPFTGTRQSTRLNTALQFTLSRVDRDRASRILLVGDGFSTEPFAESIERLQDQGVALDYRLVAQPELGDFRVSALDVPMRVQRGEPFLIEFEVEGETDGDVPFLVTRGSNLLARGTAQVREGRAVLRYTDRLDQSGAQKYEVRLQPARDAFPGNNHADRWVESVGGPRVLVVTSYANDPFAAALRGQGFEVDVVTDPGLLDPGSLTGAKAVVLNNVPAYRVPHAFLTGLDFFVRNQGGGLLMTGGRYSFGSGGYFQSPVDPLLPVSMELKQEHRKLAVAMAIVLDRSGSMMCGVAGGKPGLTKMDLADEGAARGIELLGDADAVSVIPVDSEAHVLVPLTTLGEGRGKILSATRRIQSQGGGIFVYTGLKAAWKEIKKAEQGQRHIILFADAADAEEPGDYKKLVPEIVAAGGTISVIGMGTETDCDAAFLKDVADLGKGRIFFNADANTLPALFAQETVAVSRSAYLDDPVRFVASPGWLEIAARSLKWPVGVDGYNLSYLRNDASAAAVSGDEYEAPLIATWQVGLGHSAAVSFPVGGEGAQRVLAWPAYGDFARTLARWIMARETPPGVGIRVNRSGTVINVDLLHDARWEERIAKRSPELVTVGPDGKTLQRHVWQRLEPGHYATAINLPEGQWLRGAVQVGATALPFGPVNVGGEAEWNFDRSRLTELRQAAAKTGGEERIDLSTIWKAPRLREFSDIRPLGLILWLGLFLFEALATRLGWERPTTHRAKPRPVAVPRVEPTPTARTEQPRPAAPLAERPLQHPPPKPAATEEQRAQESRRSVFDRAKRRGG